MENIQERKAALAEAFSLDDNDFKDIGYDSDEKLFKFGKQEYKVLTEEEANVKARNAVKKANKNAWITLPTPKNEVFAQVPKIQDVYIRDFFSK